MKLKTLLINLILLLFFNCKNNSRFDFFGEKNDLTNLDSYNFKINDMGPNNIKGEIIDVCPKKGCWMNVLVETDTVFVKFKDYAFFVPKQGVAGKTIYMTGEINNDTISVEMLKHYAEDANKSQSYVNSITKPKITLNMIADGVAIKN